MTVPVALIPAHSSIDDDHDDELLAHYASVARMLVDASTGHYFIPEIAVMVQAVLLLVAQLYEAREAVNFSSPYHLPFEVHDLLSPLKEPVTGHC